MLRRPDLNLSLQPLQLRWRTRRQSTPLSRPSWSRRWQNCPRSRGPWPRPYSSLVLPFFSLSPVKPFALDRSIPHQIFFRRPLPFKIPRVSSLLQLVWYYSEDRRLCMITKSKGKHESARGSGPKATPHCGNCCGLHHTRRRRRSIRRPPRPVHLHHRPKVAAM